MNNFAKTGVVAGAVAVALTGVMSGEANAIAADKEKCYGVAKAGHNGCANATGTHSCANQSTEDGAWHEWVAVPKGLCEKLAGGSTEPMEHHEDHHGDMDHQDEDHGEH